MAPLVPDTAVTAGDATSVPHRQTSDLTGQYGALLFADMTLATAQRTASTHISRSTLNLIEGTVSDPKHSRHHTAVYPWQ